MTMNGASHPRLNVGRLHLKRCKGGRELFNVEDYMLAELKSLSKYMKVREESMVKEVRRESIWTEEETKKEYQKIMHNGRLKGFTEKTTHSKFRKSFQTIANKRSCE